MNILVTGAKGFVGRNLVSQLCNVRDAKARFTGPRPKVNLFGYRNSIDQELKRHICFDAYPAIRMVGQDIKEIF